MIASPTVTYTGTLAPDADLRKKLFGAEVMRHPAKQSIPQLAHLLKRFAVRGGVLLDPFGGSGTAMLACSPLYGGMYVITVELAQRFLAMQQQAWAYFQRGMLMQAPGAGDYLPLHGDSRRLPDLFAASLEQGHRADLIITSPSYGGSEAVDQRKTQNSTIGHHGGGNEAKAGYVGNAKAPLIGRQGGQYRTHGLSPNSQLSARMYGYADTIITSPPYQDAVNHEKRRETDARRLAEGKIPTSTLAHISPNSMFHMGSYDTPLIDLVITSSPYQDSLNPEHAARGRVWADGELPPVMKIMDKKAQSRAQAVSGYDRSAENIGNLRGDKYLASMREVWTGAAMVLKPGGILCCITRDCVRDGKIVPIGDQNRVLIEAAGLTWLEREVWKVDRLSFWRILQQRKHPESPIIDCEYVDIFRRPEVA